MLQILLCVVGLVAFGAGVALVYPPAALILVGAALVAAGLLVDR